jgi:N-acetylgalactosamine-N,N'-diacetylbacillosaminyl-diphospho-undecaprenol 4-alpha-N-acetylgalactosaminyltransferase
MSPLLFVLMIFKRDYSIVQCHLVLPLFIGSILKFFNRSFELQAVHCFSYDGYLSRRNRYQKELIRYLLKFSQRLVDLHIFKSIDMLDDFKLIFGFVPHNYEIIHNPIDLSRELNLSNKFKVNFLSDKKKHVAILGRTCRSKGSYDIFKLAKVCDSVFVFHIIGDGVDYQEIAQISNDYPSVCTYGRLSDPFELVSQCELYLSLSYNEGFPNALVESMVLGLYPIHANCKTGPRELLGGSHDYDVPQETGGGFLFPPGDISSCNLGLNKYLVMSQLDKQKVLKRNKQITKNFEVVKILAKYSNVLRV